MIRFWRACRACRHQWKAAAVAAAAAHQAEVAGANKEAAIRKQNADLSALHTLLDQTYRIA